MAENTKAENLLDTSLANAHNKRKLKQVNEAAKSHNDGANQENVNI